MNQDRFNELMEKLLTACKDALGMKAGEYAREGDRLYNFYAAARKLNKHPLDSLLGMQVKYRVSIDDICEDIINHKKFPTGEMMLEKFKDDINYNLLAFALIHELREKALEKVFEKGPIMPGTIGRMASAQKVLFDEQYFLPVREEKENNCTGCFFEFEECGRFRVVAGSRFDDFCEHEAIIWKKIV